MPKTTPAAGTVTITDVAREVGVSKSTVSLVLQGSPLTRPDTAKRVREAAARLGYVYNRRAAELRRKASNIIGVVINDLTNPFFAELLVGMERRLVEAGYLCLMAHTDARLDQQEKVLTSMSEHHAAGIILCPVFGTPVSVAHAVERWGIPLLLVVRPFAETQFDFAGADNETGTRVATEHLIALGHKRIAFLGRAGAGPVYELRLAGYQKAMKKHKLAIDRQWIIDVPPTRSGGREGMLSALTLRKPPTAAVCYNDIVAFGALSALGERGLIAGRDFAVIGFDGVAATQYSNPPLTTMDVQPAKLGEAAAEILLRRIIRPNSRAARHLAVPRLVVRESSRGLQSVDLVRRDEKAQRTQGKTQRLEKKSPLGKRARVAEAT